MPRPPRIRIRNTTLEDIPAILELERVCFPFIPPDRHWVPGMLEAHVKIFPEGQWVAERREEEPAAPNGMAWRLAGSCTNLRVNLDDALVQHTWKEATGNGYLTTHKPDGDALYGTEIMVHPDCRRSGIARRLYEARKQYIRDEGMRAFVSGGRIPGYDKVKDRMSPEEYVAKVVRGEVKDRVLTAQLRSGMRVVGMLERYLTDPQSHGNATIIVWQPENVPRLETSFSRRLDAAGQPPT